MCVCMCDCARNTTKISVGGTKRFKEMEVEFMNVGYLHNPWLYDESPNKQNESKGGKKLCVCANCLLNVYKTRDGLFFRNF